MTLRISDVIRNRIQNKDGSFKSNDNIAEYLKEGEFEQLQDEIEQSFAQVLSSLVIDTHTDHNSKETPKRLAKMFCQEVFSGRFHKPPKVTDFPNTDENGGSKYDQLYVVGPISITSTCAHHWMPFNGYVWVGVSPGSKVIGLSKFHRICKFYAERPQIQEELCEQMAKAIQDATDAKGVAVLIKAKHFCVCNRGVRDQESQMVTSKLLGDLQTRESMRQEFFQIVGQLKESTK